MWSIFFVCFAQEHVNHVWKRVQKIQCVCVGVCEWRYENVRQRELFYTCDTDFHQCVIRCIGEDSVHRVSTHKLVKSICDNAIKIDREFQHVFRLNPVVYSQCTMHLTHTKFPNIFVVFSTAYTCSSRQCLKPQCSSSIEMNVNTFLT